MRCSEPELGAIHAPPLLYPQQGRRNPGTPGTCALHNRGARCGQRWPSTQGAGICERDSEAPVSSHDQKTDYHQSSAVRERA